MTTNATKHTPGPWHIKRNEYGAGHVVYVGPLHAAEDHVNVGFGGGPDDIRARGEANARLIASAPDLLAERDRLRVENATLRAALYALTKSPGCAGDGGLGLLSAP